MTTHTHDTLVHRLARIEGQVRALKEQLSSDTDVDCARTLFQVKAATNGLKRFAEEFARAYTRHCIAQKKQPAHLARELDELLGTVFTLS